MYILKTETAFDSAHFLSGYNGKCSNLHGHTWKISAEIYSETLQQDGQCRGMVVDFSDLKSKLKMLADSFDHKFIYEKNTLNPQAIDALKFEKFNLKEVDFRPTAENFARYFFEELKQDGFSVKRVYVYETPNNCAIYEE